MTAPKPCIFCGSPTNKKSKEHVLPRWLENYVPSHATRSFRLVDIDDWGPERETDAVERDLPIGTYEQVAGGVCKRCNETWMERLESEVRPILIDIFAGGTRRLTHAERSILAAWVWKTAAMVQGLAAPRH